MWREEKRFSRWLSAIPWHFCTGLSLYIFSTFRHCLHGTQVNRPIGHHTDVKMPRKFIDVDAHRVDLAKGTLRGIGERQKESGQKTSKQFHDNGNIFSCLSDMFCLLTASTILQLHGTGSLSVCKCV